jgi:hypothetical protein
MVFFGFSLGVCLSVVEIFGQAHARRQYACLGLEKVVRNAARAMSSDVEQQPPLKSRKSEKENLSVIDPSDTAALLSSSCCSDTPTEE